MTVQTLIRKTVLGVPAAGAAAALAMAGSAQAGDNMNEAKFDQKVMNAVERCELISTDCAASMGTAAGALVFPEVMKASLGVGGSGAKGALVIDGEIEGYYSLWNASLGLQAGVQEVTQTIVFETDDALMNFQDTPEWEVGADADVTLATAGATADATTGGEDGDVISYVFDEEGLAAGLAIEGTRVQRYEHEEKAGEM